MDASLHKINNVKINRSVQTMQYLRNSLQIHLGSNNNRINCHIDFKFIRPNYRQSHILKNLTKLLPRSYNPPTNLFPTRPHPRCLQLRQITLQFLDNNAVDGKSIIIRTRWLRISYSWREWSITNITISKWSEYYDNNR